MIKALAIDDEPIALDIIKNYAAKVSFLQLDATFVNAFEAIEYLNRNDVDVLFLDIKMPDISGIDFYNSLVRKPLLVFTTAYSEHAITGFELEALDYLLKPFAFSRFLKTCNKAYEILQSKRKNPTHIYIKDGHNIVKLNFDEILFIEATGNYMKYVMPTAEILTRSTIKEIIEQLPSEVFQQVHRSFIVNLDKVSKIERHQLSIASHVIPISASYSNVVKNTVL
ncbi:LytR/AlgR family response regulator transcription factor [Sphingobacterium faecale]|uniref:Response regulator transcription factor n=1 Tax=Sphingobacterium faecale TaxID=2803775 RepID=A0ABS1R2F9_9SPHI|nr:LytTR family DNA-binding domain-containing protein [Sphingobacterium faecale]MBL1408897.1 response regulator transcription factor [Sphingobacterium faecale]